MYRKLSIQEKKELLKCKTCNKKPDYLHIVCGREYRITCNKVCNFILYKGSLENAIQEWNNKNK